MSCRQASNKLLEGIHGAYGEGFEENKIAMKQNRVETAQPANGVGR